VSVGAWVAKKWAAAEETCVITEDYNRLGKSEPRKEYQGRKQFLS
jgi:hypothetical protein